jgi:hypothetical protein
VQSSKKKIQIRDPDSGIFNAVCAYQDRAFSIYVDLLSLFNVSLSIGKIINYESIQHKQ